MPLTHESIKHLESLIPLYPPRFPTIEAVKSYIASITSIPLTNPSANKLAFLVAVRAFEAGEFYLDVPLLDRGALRRAITSCVEVVLGKIHSWPGMFVHVGFVKKFIAATCPEIRDMVFESVERSVFQGYVLFHAARGAWEARRFEMRWVPKGWVRVPRSLTETVELNITTLTPLLPPWPPIFTDLNEARDHVKQCCYAMHFRYMYFPGEEDKTRFRTIVHFNTAKYALQRGEFGLDGRGQTERFAKREREMVVGEKMEKLGGKKETGKVSTAPYSLVRGGGVVGESWEAFRARAEGGEMVIGQAEIERAGENTQKTTEDGEVKTEEETAEKQGEVETEEKVEMKEVDPFKGLIADLRRVSILKAAFE